MSPMILPHFDGPCGLLPGVSTQSNMECVLFYIIRKWHIVIRWLRLSYKDHKKERIKTQLYVSL